mmetsp:Transcript_16916/g.53672  ORF Transcript_16916/g.53672 Transcript_16916/m.53672 type:complete len:115 (+) Transcript_16916:3496-3840(+)
MQFRTHGINKDDCCVAPAAASSAPPNEKDETSAELSKHLNAENEDGTKKYSVHESVCDVDQCRFCGRQPAPKPRPPKWGPLDKAGKTWGEVKEDENGVCQCAAPALHECNGTEG